MSGAQNFYLTCPRGLEAVTAEDIRPYCESVMVDKGGVQFTGDQETLYTVNLYSRTGMYALELLATFNVRNDTQLYNEVHSFDWYSFMTPADTFSVRARTRSTFFKDSNYSGLKVKDAIVDRLRTDAGRRPNVEKENPRYSFFVFIRDDVVKLYLNSSGNTLFMRGYREKIHKASLNEALAAGLILLSGWQKDQPFYDPMCGSGTLPIEAAMMARNIPPAIKRKKFAFQGWSDYNHELWKNILKKAESNIKGDPVSIYGSDFIRANIRLAKENALRIGVKDNIQFKEIDIKDFKPKSDSGVILTNPPYGERVGELEKLSALYKIMGDVFKTKCINHDAFVFSGSPELTREIGLKAKEKIPLRNGDIDCRLLHYPIREGEYA